MNGDDRDVTPFLSNNGILPFLPLLLDLENKKQGGGKQGSYVVQPQGTVHMNMALELCSVAVLRKRDSLSDGEGLCVLSPRASWALVRVRSEWSGLVCCR